MKLPLVSPKKLMKILSTRGFQIIRQRSSHVQMKDSDGRLVTIPIHSGRDVSIGVLMKILRDAEISREEFVELEKSA
jgi:predicted RNA binding protein YcfA (HicA-like mRNA interferase family)